MATCDNKNCTVHNPKKNESQQGESKIHCKRCGRTIENGSGFRIKEPTETGNYMGYHAVCGRMAMVTLTGEDTSQKSYMLYKPKLPPWDEKPSENNKQKEKPGLKLPEEFLAEPRRAGEARSVPVYHAAWDTTATETEEPNF